jgi:hypothetical protein
MGEVQLRSLRVEAQMDPSGFVDGAQRLKAAANDAAASAAQFGANVGKAGVTVSQQDSRFSRTVSEIERLKRSFIDGYASTQAFEKGMNTISRGLTNGALTAAQADAAILGLNRKYSLMADATAYATAGQTELAASIERVNAQLARQAGIKPVGVNDNVGGGAGASKQVLGYQLFDIGQGLAMGAPAAMILAQQGPQIVQIYAGNGGVNAAFRDLSSILMGVARTAGPVIATVAGVYGAYKILQANSAEAALAVSDLTRELAGQASPISSLQSSVAELAKIQESYSHALTTTATAHDDATRSIVANSEREFNAKKSLLELELKRQEASVALMRSEMAVADLQLRNAVRSQVNTQLDLERQGYADPRAGSVPFVRVPDDVTGVEKTWDVIANNPANEKITELRSNVTLTEIAVGKLRDGLKQMFNPGGDSGPTFPNGIPIPTPRPAYELEGDDKVSTSATKAEGAYQQLIRTANQRIAQVQHEIEIAGQVTDVQARLRLEFEMMAQAQEAAARNNKTLSEQELAAIKAKADALANLNQIAAGQKFDQSQQDQLRALQLEANLIGASAQERARANAVFQAEQQMRQAGLSLMGQEADARRNAAAAMADYRLEIERQNAAWQSAQQAGATAIDQLTIGTGSLKDRLKNVANTLLEEFQRLSIANPLKNALFGQNNPTLGDLFSGKPTSPSVPGSTTGTMTVTAGTVMINGGLPGLPGLPGTGATTTLGDFLKGPAANGVRPDLTNGGIVNNPAGKINGFAPAAAPTDIEAYIRQAAAARGIDPNTAVAVARSEGGLQSWNQQSKVPIGNGQFENSWGPFQLYKDGGLGNEFQRTTGLDPALAQNGPAGVDFALDHASKNGWGSWYGARNTGIGDWQGIGKNPGIDPMKTNSVDQLNSGLSKLSATTASTTKDIGGLGDSSSSLTSTLSDFLNKPANSPSAPGSFPPAPMGPNYFPPAPQAPSGFNFLSLLKGIPLIGPFFSLLGFADGTDYAPGGVALVGERGPEIVNLPRGSQVVPNHKLGAANNGGGARASRMKVDVGVSVDDNGKLQAYVRSISESAAAEHSRAAVSAYDLHMLPGRMKQISEDPYATG